MRKILKGAAPGMLNSIRPPPGLNPGVLFMSRIAWRNEPGPESLVLVTTRRRSIRTLKVSVAVSDFSDASGLKSRTLTVKPLVPGLLVVGVKLNRPLVESVASGRRAADQVSAFVGMSGSVAAS